jgi:hypothetical protein
VTGSTNLRFLVKPLHQMDFARLLQCPKHWKKRRRRKLCRRSHSAAVNHEAGEHPVHELQEVVQPSDGMKHEFVSP